MSSLTEFVQLPPDGSGKKVRHRRNTELRVASFMSLPEQAERVRGSVSGAEGNYTGYRALDDNITLYLEDVSGVFVAGEQLRDLSGTTTYTATIINVSGDVYTPVVQIGDPNVLDNRLEIDDAGAAYVTFPEGTPQFDAYGRMQVSQLFTIGAYNHIGYDRAELFWTKTEGAGTVTYDPTSSSAYYTIGVNVGDEARRTTNLYHPYRSGTSQLIMTTVICGDQGKVGLIREWGYFDDLNGFGFRQKNGQMYVFLRSDVVTGSPVEIEIPQSDWNENSLDNPTTSLYVLNSSRGNTYWMDMEWFGVGRVRMGVYGPKGQRITCHVFENANANEWPFMRTGSLPVTWSMRNTGVTGSGSEMRVTGATVFNETRQENFFGRRLHYSPPAPKTIAAGNDYRPILSFRSKLLVNGKPNRIAALTERIEFMSLGTAPVHVAIIASPSSLTGSNFSIDVSPPSSLEIDITSTAMSQDGVIIASYMLPPGGAINPALDGTLEYIFSLGADNSQRIYTVAARSLTPGVDVDVFYALRWREVR